MLEVARSRNVPNCPIAQGDVRALPFDDASWDIAVTERCIINVMNVDEQAQSLAQVARVLRPGGHFVCIEAFTDGLEQLNAARGELGLQPNVQPHHNIWFDKQWFLKTAAPFFEVVDLAAENDPSLPPPNFLSSHYFMSRVVYPSATKREVLYNTHFVKFFSVLPPMGNYAPIQLYLLKRR
jgi:SAM-dependent methyltransferase